MTERELAEYFQSGALSGEPRSVGEALAAADSEAAASEPVVDEPAPEVGEPTGPPVVVEDDPTEPAPELGEAPEEPTEVEAPEEEEQEPEEEIEDENVVWATKKYGDDPAKWAQAARHQEQHISRLAAEKKEAEELAAEWYEYAQGLRAAGPDAAADGDAAVGRRGGVGRAGRGRIPTRHAMQAAMQGNFNLYNGVIARVAEENPMMAAQIGAQVQREMEQLAMQQQQQQNGQQMPQPTLAEAMGESIQRLGIDLAAYGDADGREGRPNSGEYHPYVQTILEGEPGARDIALMAVYDLVRSTAMSTRKVRSEERENQIKHEAELRRQAAGVVTGGPRSPEAPQRSPFMDAMEQEWKARGQWSEE